MSDKPITDACITLIAEHERLTGHRPVELRLPSALLSHMGREYARSSVVSTVNEEAAVQHAITVGVLLMGVWVVPYDTMPLRGRFTGKKD